MAKKKYEDSGNDALERYLRGRSSGGGKTGAVSTAQPPVVTRGERTVSAGSSSGTPAASGNDTLDDFLRGRRRRTGSGADVQAKISAAEAQEEADRKRREQERAWRMQELAATAAEASRQGFRSVGQLFHRDPAATAGAAAERTMRMNQLYQAMADEAARTGNQELLRYAQERSQETVGQARNVFEQQRTGNRPGIPGAAQGLLNAQERATEGRSYQPEAPTDRNGALQTRLYNAAARWAPVSAAMGDQPRLEQDVRTMQRAAGNLERIEDREREAYYREHPEERIAATMTQEEIRQRIRDLSRGPTEEETQAYTAALDLLNAENVGLFPDENDPKVRAMREQYRQASQGYNGSQINRDELRRYQQALQIRTYQDQAKQVQEISTAAMADPAFAGTDVHPSASLQKMLGTDSRQHDASERFRLEYYSLDRNTERKVFNYLWNKDEAAGDTAHTQALQYLRTIPDIEARYYTAYANKWYIPQSYDSTLLGAGKVLSYIVDSLLSGSESAMAQGMDALEGRVSTGEARNTRELGTAMQNSGTFYRALGGAAQSAGRMIPAMMAGNVAAGFAQTFPVAVASIAETTNGVLTAERIVRGAQNTTFFLTSKGAAMQEGMRKGLNQEQAEIYSTLSALSEVGLQNVIGGIASFGGIGESQLAAKIARIDNVFLRTAAHMGLNISGEVIEENAQNWLEPLTISLLTGDEFEAPTWEETLETTLSTALMVGGMNVGDTVSYYNSSQIRSNLRKISEDFRAAGGDYGRIAADIDAWIQEVDADPNGRFTKEDFGRVFDIIGKGQEAMREHDVTPREIAETIRAKQEEVNRETGEAVQNEQAVQETATPTPAGAEGQQTAQTGPGQQTASLPSMALESVEAEGRAIGIQSGQGMTDAEIRQNVQTLLELQQDPGQTEAGAASLRGQIRGLQEVLNERAVARGDDLGLAEGLGRIGLEDVGAASQSGRQVDGPTGDGEGGQIANDAGDGGAIRGSLPAKNGVRDGGPVPYGNGGLNNERIQGRSEVGGIGQNAGTDATSSVSLGADTFPSRGRLAGGQLVRAAGEQGTVAGDAGAADGGQRNAGLDSRGPAGVLGESAGRAAVRAAERGGSRKEELAAIRNYVQAQGTERRSARDLGIRDGTKNARNVLLEGEALSDSMVRLQTEAEQAGTRLDFVTGSIEAVAGGQVRRAAGVFQVDEDGTPHIFVQADSRARSPEQLYRHELFHSIVKQNRGLWQQIVEHLNRNYTQEEIASIVGSYIDAYDGCYGVDEADVERYLEEIFADVYADMDRGGSRERASREALQPVAQRFAGDIENARQNRAGIERRNGPGTRLSASETEAHSPEQLAVIREYQNSSDPEVENAFIEKYQNPNAKFRRISISQVSERQASDASRLLGGNFSGYTNAINSNGIQHTIVRHGPNGKQDHSMADFKDAGRIGYVLDNYDTVEIALDKDGKPDVSREFLDEKHRPAPKLKYSKRVDGTYYIIQAVPETSVKKMWVVSAYMQKADSVTQTLDVQSPLATSETSFASPLPVDYNIAGKNSAVNMNQENTVDWAGNRGTMLSQAEEEDGEDWAGSEEEDEAPPHPSASQTPSPQGEGSGGQIARAAESGRPMIPAGHTAAPTETGDADAVGLARDKKVALAEKATIDGLKSRIQSAEDRLRALKAMQSTGLLARDAQSQAEWKRRVADVEETLKIDRAALKAKQDARKAEKANKAKQAAKRAERKREKAAARKEAELTADKPRQARKEFREGALDLFGVPAGKRGVIGNILNGFADRMIEQGSVSGADRRDLFRQLYEAGTDLIPADEAHQSVRDYMTHGRIYVPDIVRADFGEEWGAFQERAWKNKIYLTYGNRDRTITSWYRNLTKAFPDTFDADLTDPRTILEEIVEMAEAGQSERILLNEMMRRNFAETGMTVDQQMDELEQKVDRLIDTFAQKASLEQKVRTEGAMKLAMERKRNRARVEEAQQRRRENQIRSEVMKQLQQLNKMRKKSKPEVQAQIDAIKGNLDTMARQITPAGLENLQELARKYNEAKDDPNFLGNPYVEQRLARLGQVQLDDMEISDVIELGRTIAALVKSVQENHRLLTDARNAEISAAAGEAAGEIRSSTGSRGGKLRDFYGKQHLSPTRMIQMLGGWTRGGRMEQLAQALEDGGTRRLDYMRQATRIFDAFTADKANQKWLRKAQGKDAEWISVTVPVGITDAGGTVHMENQTFEITPMMRVGLLMHSKNADNLRHIETGGIVIPDKGWYRKGNLAEADARGTRVKLQPEVVRAIVKDCTAQERAFAALLEQYYDGFSKDRINEVSMEIDGFERAGGDHYYGIKVSRKFLAAQPEQIQRNMSLESIGSIVNERIHAGNPIILEDASTALTDHIDLISKYYGFTAAIRDFNAVMNYTFHEKAQGEDGEYVANAYAGSIKEILQDKWGSGAQAYLDKMLADLQQSSGVTDSVAQFLAKLRGNLAGASLMANLAVMLSQTASLPGAMQSLGPAALMAGLKPAKVDMGLVEKYSPVLWYRNQGNSTQELGDYLKAQGFAGKLPLIFDGIQKMDSWTIRRLWAAAEYKVRHETDLTPGSQAEIDAGTDPFYQEVARYFQRAVYDTQPNYTEMQRPGVLRTDSDLMKFMTMYKTVPLQYYNMMFEAAGRLRADAARAKANDTQANRENLKKSRSFAVQTFAGILGANVVYVVIKAAIKALTGRGKKYEDEEGDITLQSALPALGKDLAETYAGSLIFGSELLSSLEKVYGAATTGSYSRYGGLEVSAFSAIEDTIGELYNLASRLQKEDYRGGLDAIKELAKQLAMDTGFPANNMETYLKGVLKWVAPEWVDRYENFFDEFERADMKGRSGDELRTGIRVLMDNRCEGLSDETVDELGRLFEVGFNQQLPSGIPEKVTVEGEEIKIGWSEHGNYREIWGQVVAGNLEKLLASDGYAAADDKGKADLIKKLYDYAGQTAAGQVTGKGMDNWVLFGKACVDAGIPLEDYLAVAAVSKDKIKDMDGTELDEAIRARMEFRVGDLEGDVLDELGRLYAGGAAGVIPADVPTSFSVAGEDVKLTPEQRVSWMQAWQRTTGESLGALLDSQAFQKASDEDKAKLIGSLYDVASAAAKSEIQPGYEPDKWIRIGREAEARGISMADYILYRKAAAGASKAADKLKVLQDQKWTQDQKAFIWEQSLASETQLKKWATLRDSGVKWKDAMELLGAGESSGNTGMSESEKAKYDVEVGKISGPATKRLLNNSAYKKADKATKAAYLDRLNDYAGKLAKSKVIKGFDAGKWVEQGERLTKAGVQLDEYIVYYAGISDANSRAKYEALANTRWSESQKMIAMEYISTKTAGVAAVGRSYQIGLSWYLEGLTRADTNENGSISQEEATDYLDGLDLGREDKAYLWQMLCSSSKWKKNPYSTVAGEEIWHSLNPEE